MSLHNSRYDSPISFNAIIFGWNQSKGEVYTETKIVVMPTDHENLRKPMLLKFCLFNIDPEKVYCTFLNALK